MSFMELTKESLDRLAKSLVDKPKPVDPAITYGIPKTIKPKGSEIDNESDFSQSTKSDQTNHQKPNQIIKPKKKKQRHQTGSSTCKSKPKQNPRDHSLVSTGPSSFDSKTSSSIATTSNSLVFNSTSKISLGFLVPSSSGTQRLNEV
ncbi:uncharacterized protein MELLADRAFT_61594 [Melampsora larici-populina 98AG31]|uniref:Uncharacterized protein n=1 Tax=Melampsora larici-populina (strain 98AG31 / pathotype 3-4-7) TaxID=747676 RepID=F4RFK0_MELLP|nr:uncharacterized protein MELLADRAFT_61594 [Melampsora larici-populina 98AG31]EGG08821.1 hypothetical protein MELLADRAFT_61594 [Melampsora larici-populina 98AG31]